MVWSVSSACHIPSRTVEGTYLSKLFPTWMKMSHCVCHRTNTRLGVVWQCLQLLPCTSMWPWKSSLPTREKWQKLIYVTHKHTNKHHCSYSTAIGSENSSHSWCILPGSLKLPIPEMFNVTLSNLGPLWLRSFMLYMYSTYKYTHAHHIK